jgi:energy-coupling factor transporter ATP-binding protein EcfA2
VLQSFAACLMEETSNAYFTVTASVEFTEDLVLTAREKIIEESAVEVAVIQIEKSSILCSCSSNDFDKLRPKYSFKKIQFNVTRVDSPDSVIISFRREDGEAIHCSDPALIRNKIKSEYKDDITPKECNLGTSTWLFTCAKNAEVLDDVPLMVYLDDEGLLCESQTQSKPAETLPRHKFIMATEHGDDIPAYLDDQSIIDLVKESAISVDERKPTYVVCSCSSEDKVKLKSKYSRRKTVLVIKDTENIDAKSDATTQGLVSVINPTDGQVASPAPFNAQTLQQMFAAKKLIHSENRFIKIRPVSMVAEDKFLLTDEKLNLLLQHFKHEENKFLCDSSRKFVFMSLESQLPANIDIADKDRLVRQLSLTLLRRGEVSSIVQTLVEGDLSEGNHYATMRADILSLQDMWNKQSTIILQAESQLTEAIRQFVRDTPALANTGEIRTVASSLEDILHQDIDCLASSIWRLIQALNHLLGEVSFSSMSEKHKAFGRFAVGIESKWNDLMETSNRTYIDLSSICTKILNEIRPMDLSELWDIATNINIQTFEGKDVIPIIGNSGAGKSTLFYFLHGLSFHRDSPEGSTSVLYDPIEKNGILKQLRDMGVKSAALDESQTSSVIPVEIWINGIPYLFLDTPGFGDTRGPVIDLINGYMIGKALQSAQSVRPVLLIDFEKRKLTDSSKSTFRTYSNLVRPPIDDNLSHFNFVVTRLDEAAEFKTKDKLRKDLSGEFEVIRDAFTSDEGARDFCSVLSSKLKAPSDKSSAMILDLRRDNYSDYLNRFVQSAAIKQPAKSFGDCISSTSRAALKRQLEYTARSMLSSLSTANIWIVEKRLSQLAALKVLLDIVEISSAFTNAVVALDSAIDDKIMSIELRMKQQIPLQQHEAKELVQTLLIIYRAFSSDLLASHLPIIKKHVDRHSFLGDFFKALSEHVAILCGSIDLPLSEDPMIKNSTASKCARAFEAMIYLKKNLEPYSSENQHFNELIRHVKSAINEGKSRVEAYFLFLNDSMKGSFQLQPMQVMECYDLIVVTKASMDLVRALSLDDQNLRQSIETELNAIPAKFAEVLTSVTMSYLKIDYDVLSIDMARNLKDFFVQLKKLKRSLKSDYQSYIHSFDLSAVIIKLSEYITVYVTSAKAKVMSIQVVTSSASIPQKEVAVLKLWSDLVLVSESSTEDRDDKFVNSAISEIGFHLSSECNKVLEEFQSQLHDLFVSESVEPDLNQIATNMTSQAQTLLDWSFAHADLHLSAFASCKTYFTHLNKIDHDKVKHFDKLAIIMFKAQTISSIMTLLLSFQEKSNSDMFHLTGVNSIANKFQMKFTKLMEEADIFVDSLVILFASSDGKTLISFKGLCEFLAEAVRIAWTLPPSLSREDRLIKFKPCRQVIDEAVAKWKAAITQKDVQIRWTIADYGYDPNSIFEYRGSYSELARYAEVLMIHALNLDTPVFEQILVNLKATADNFLALVNDPATSTDIIQKILATSEAFLQIDEYLEEVRFVAIIPLATARYGDLSNRVSASIDLGDFYYLHSLVLSSTEKDKVAAKIGDLIGELESQACNRKLKESSLMAMWKTMIKVRNGLYYFGNLPGYSLELYRKRFVSLLSNDSQGSTDEIWLLIPQLERSMSTLEATNLRQMFKDYSNSIPVDLKDGHMMRAYSKLLTLAVAISSFSCSLACPVDPSTTNAVRCLFCNKSQSIVETEAVALITCKSCSRSQPTTLKPGMQLFSEEENAITSFHEYLDRDIFVPLLLHFQAVIEMMDQKVAAFCIGTLESDDSIEIMGNESPPIDAMSIVTEKFPVEQFTWIGQALYELHFDILPKVESIRSLQPEPLKKLFGTIWQYKSISEKFKGHVKTALKKFDILNAVYDKSTNDLKTATPLEFSRASCLQPLIKGLQVALRVLKKCTQIVNKEMIITYNQCYIDFHTFESLLHEKLDELGMQGGHALTEVLRLVDGAKREELFRDFRSKIKNVKHDITHEDERKKLRDVCELIAVNGTHWEKHTGFQSLIKGFLIEYYEPFVTVANEYFAEVKEGRKIKKKLSVGTSIQLKADDLITILSGAKMVGKLQQWFVGDAAVMGFVERLEKLLISILDFLDNRIVELDRVIQDAEKYVPDRGVTEVSSSIYSSQSLTHADIERLERYFDDILKLRSVIPHVISLDRYYQREPFKGKIDGCKRFDHFDERLTKLQEGVQRLLKYLYSVDSRQVLEARDVTGKTKYYSLLYSSELLQKRVFAKYNEVNDSNNADQTSSQIIRDIENCLERCLSLINGINAMSDRNHFEDLSRNIDIINTIYDVCVNYRSEANEAKESVNRAMRDKLAPIVNMLWLDDLQWNDKKYTDHVSHLTTDMILLKTIGSCIPSFDAMVTLHINESITKYTRDRSQPEMYLHGFLGLLCSSLDITPGGEQVIQSVKALEGYKFHLRNTEFSQVKYDVLLAGLKTMSGDALQLEQTQKLKAMYETIMNHKKGEYWTLVNRCLKTRLEIEHIPGMIINLAEQIQTCSDADEVARYITRIIAHFFAYWTLKNLDGFDALVGSTNATSYLLQPHPAQLFAIMRILGLDSDGFYIKNIFDMVARTTDYLWTYAFGNARRAHKPYTLRPHMAEIKTGEGKSVVLACVAAVIALLGFDVDIACYSKYLSDRDAEAFKFMFEDCGIQDRIFYGTFKELGERLLDRHKTLRPLVSAVIKSKVAEANGLRNNTPHFSRDKILLIDEVDVLFSKSFYGQAYNIFSSLDGKDTPAIIALFDFIYSNRTQKIGDLWNSVEKAKCYRDCLDGLQQWQFLIENAAKKMVLDVHRLDEHLKQFKPKVENGDIWYFDDDNKLTNKKRFGYITAFAYMHFHSLDSTQISPEMLLSAKSILITVGSISYSELPKLYLCAMGVTGTLSTLAREQKALLAREYGLPAERTTLVESAYPENNRAPYVGRLGLDIFAGLGANYFNAIKDQIICNIIDTDSGKPRAVLVYFKDDRSLIEFFSSRTFDDYRQNAQTLTTETPVEKVQEVVSKAVVPGQVTLVIAAFGRGTDYFYANKALDKARGIHVIQTFFSEEFSEEVQIRGRTARQGHPGSYCMVLGEGDFEIGGITDLNNIPSEVVTKFTETREARSTKKYSETANLVMMQKQQHEKSSKVLRLLFSNQTDDLPQLVTELQELNAVNIQIGGRTLRTMVLMDGTSSMGILFEQAKAKVKEIVTSVGNILKANNVNDGFEVQFVVYRNYNSPAELLLEFSSPSSDPNELFAFMNRTKIDGGWGHEAIEVALWFVNRVLEDKPGGIAQVILIGDAAPNTMTNVDEKRQYKGEKYWSATNYKTKTLYTNELAKIAAAKVPIHTNYLADCAKDTFEEIAKVTGGTHRMLNLGTIAGANAEGQLDVMLAYRILASVQKNLADAFLTTKPDVGFVP